MGGHLAAQAVANTAAALVFWFALKLKLVSYIPTALRIGAGYGVAILVGVLGMRSLGLLVANSFVLSTFTWESVRNILCRFPTTADHEKAPSVDCCIRIISLWFLWLLSLLLFSFFR